MIVSVTHFQPLTVIQRERLLPFPGRVLVRKGQRVSSSETLAECDLIPGFVLVDYGRGLGVSPQQADEYLQVKPGMELEKNDLIAGPVGLMRRVVRSPYAGRVELTGEGQLLLRLRAKSFALSAGFSGTVIELIENRGAILQTVGVLVQGIWGNGQAASGSIVVASEHPEAELTETHLDQRAQNAILLGSYVTRRATLEKAAVLPIRGLVLGGIEGALISVAEKMPYPILVVDGFGAHPMNAIAYPLLASNEGREAFLNAQSWDAFRGKRPEVIIPLPLEEYPSPSSDTAELAVGKRVRICRSPYCGRIGTIEQLLTGTTILPNGLSVQAAQVRLAEDEWVVSPIVNLEVIEA